MISYNRIYIYIYIFIFFRPIENIWTKIADKQKEEEVNLKKKGGVGKKKWMLNTIPFFYRSNNNSNKRFNNKTE